MKISSADFLHLKAHERLALLTQWLESEDGDDLCVQGTRNVLAKAPVFLTPTMLHKGGRHRRAR